MYFHILLPVESESLAYIKIFLDNIHPQPALSQLAAAVLSRGGLLSDPAFARG